MSWVGVGEAYAQSYGALCAGTAQPMRELLGAAGGRTLLDVGAGDGTLAAAWADAGWQVTACEPEPSMRTVARRQHPHLRIIDGALAHLPVDDEKYDVVVANFVLNHIDDPRAGAAELRRVARGHAVASIWTRSPSWFWAEVTTKAGLAPASGDRLPAERDFERTSSGFDRMLRDAGWSPEVIEFTWTWRPTGDMLWRSVVGGVAGAGTFFATLASDDRERFHAAFMSVIADRAEDSRIALTQTAAIAVDQVG